jgi:hypothetical protein
MMRLAKCRIVEEGYALNLTYVSEAPALVE